MQTLHTQQLITTGARMHCSCLHAALAECCTECVRLGGAMLSDTLQQQQFHNTQAATLLSRYRCPDYHKLPDNYSCKLNNELGGMVA